MRKPEQSTSSGLLAIEGQFAEFDQFMEFAAAWDIDFRQVGRGMLNASLSQAVGESWSFSKARFDRPAYQRGAAVKGMRTFALLDASAPEIEWCGRQFSPDILAVFASDGEFQSISKPGFNVYTASFTEEQLSKACIRLGIPDVIDRLGSNGTTLRIDTQHAAKLCSLINCSLQALCQANLPNPVWMDATHIRDKIAEQLVVLLTDSSRLSRTPSQRVRSMAIHRALEVIEDGLDKGISVREVASESNISRRTLEYAFREKYGFSPKAFINSQRLVRVRRDLLTQARSVTDTANRWGFWHMGQFAQDYMRHYGELPSQTRRY